MVSQGEVCVLVVSNDILCPVSKRKGRRKSIRYKKSKKRQRTWASTRDVTDSQGRGMACSPGEGTKKEEVVREEGGGPRRLDHKRGRGGGGKQKFKSGLERRKKKTVGGGVRGMCGKGKKDGTQL